MDRIKRFEELSIDELKAMLKDFHALMWAGDGCEVCAHCVVEHREPYYKTTCTLDGRCNPLWRGLVSKVKP